MTDITIDQRIEALDRAVRVTLAKGGQETDADTIRRAEAFAGFLAGKSATDDKLQAQRRRDAQKAGSAPRAGRAVL